VISGEEDIEESTLLSEGSTTPSSWTGIAVPAGGCSATGKEGNNEDDNEDDDNPDVIGVLEVDSVKKLADVFAEEAALSVENVEKEGKALDNDSEEKE
jgi:hypothetical protein